MCVIHADNILDEKKPVAGNRHPLPYREAGWRLTVVQRLEHGLLIGWIKFNKWPSKHMLCDFGDSFQSKAMRFLIGRHSFKPVAIESVFVKTLVDEIYDRYFVEFVAIVLRQNSIAYSSHQLGFFGRKEAYRRNFLYSGENYISRRLVPKSLLANGCKPRVVARLCARWQRLSRIWINGSPVMLSARHQRSLRNRLASNPRNPHAAKSSGAKMGGPYMML